MRVEDHGEIDLPILTTGDPTFTTRYMRRNYRVLDPVLKASRQGDLPVDWRDLDHSSTEARRYFSELHRFEFGRNGMIIPIHACRSDAVFSFTSQIADVPTWLKFRRKIKPDMALLSRYFHDKVITLLKGGPDSAYLSQQEKTCLQLCSEGHNAVAISSLLGLSVHTVRMHLNNAQKRLRVRSRPEAVAKALQFGLIWPAGRRGSAVFLLFAWLNLFQPELAALIAVTG